MARRLKYGYLFALIGIIELFGCNSKSLYNTDILEGREGQNVKEIVFSPNGKQIAAVYEESLRVWDATTGATLFDLDQRLATPGKLKIKLVQYSSDGTQIFVKANFWDEKNISCKLRAWNAESGKLLWERTYQHWNNDAGVSTDGKRIWVAYPVDHSNNPDWSTTFSVWIFTRGDDSDRVIATIPNAIEALFLSPTGERMLIRNKDFSQSVWSLDKNLPKELFHFPSNVQFLNWYPAQNVFVDVSDLENHAIQPPGPWKVTIYDGQTGRIIQKISVSNLIRDALLSPNGKMLITGSRAIDDPMDLNSQIQQWDVETGRLIRTLTSRAYLPRTLQISPDARLITASFFDDARAHLWDTATGSLIAILTPNPPKPTDLVAFSPDGKQLVERFSENSLAIFDLSNL